MTQTSIRIGGYRENRRERAHVKEETRCIPFFPGSCAAANFPAGEAISWI